MAPLSGKIIQNFIEKKENKNEFARAQKIVGQTEKFLIFGRGYPGLRQVGPLLDEILATCLLPSLNIYAFIHIRVTIIHESGWEIYKPTATPVFLYYNMVIIVKRYTYCA